MKIANVIKALEKKGWKVEFSQREIYDYFEKKYVLSTKQFFCKNQKNKVSFHQQDDQAICVKVQGLNEYDDSQSDYFPGTFCRSIKMIIQAMEW